MACCKCCCGNADCAEGDQGKCCCGGSCCDTDEYCCGGGCQSDPCCDTDEDCSYVVASCSGAGESGCGFGCDASEGYYFPDTAGGLAAALAYLDAYDEVPECGTCSADVDIGKCCGTACYPDPTNLPACAGSPPVCPD